MEYISESEFNFYQSKIEHYKKHCENLIIPCAICGIKSTGYVLSFVGYIKWYMCDKHKEAKSYMGLRETGPTTMGVTIDGVPQKMNFLNEQDKVLIEFYNKN